MIFPPFLLMSSMSESAISVPLPFNLQLLSIKLPLPCKKVNSGNESLRNSIFKEVALNTFINKLS